MQNRIDETLKHKKVSIIINFNEATGERSLRNGMLAWVACLRGWHGWCAIVGKVGGVPAWVALVAWWRGYCASMCEVGGVDDVLTWLACYYYFYFYYWNTILKIKILNVYFWSKNKKMFQIDLNSDLKKNLSWRAGVALHYLNR